MIESMHIIDQQKNLYVRTVTIDQFGNIAITTCAVQAEAMNITNANFAILLMHTLNSKEGKGKGKQDIKYILMYHVPILKL